MHKKMIEYIRGKWKDPVCPLCSGLTWSVAETVYELRQYNSGGIALVKIPIVPIIPVTCLNCGYTILLNSIVSGLTNRKVSDG